MIGSTLNHGNVLYQDIYSQHQPIQFVLSAVMQKVTTPDNILVNIKWHREFMIIWSIGWVLVLTLRFGAPLLATSAILELTKISFLGNLFLAESFVLYPLLYLMAYFLSSKKVRSSVEQILIIFLIYFVALSLAPLWPLLAFYSAWMIYTSPSRLKLILAFLGVGCVYLIPLSFYINFAQYLNDVIFINSQFYIPLTSDHNLIESLALALIVPLKIIITSSLSSLMILLKTLSIAYLILLAALIKARRFAQVFWIITFVTLSNIRYIDPTSTLYGAFHLLPWIGIYTAVAFIPTPIFKPLRTILIVLIFASALNHAQHNLFDRRDVVHDYVVHYSPSEDLRYAVSTLADGRNMSMWVEPVQYWPYWQTGVSQYSHMVNYYGWMDQTPPLRDPLLADFKESLPSIVYSVGEHLAIGPYLGSYLPLMRDNKATGLYLRRDLLGALTPLQLTRLADYRFAFASP